MCCSVLQCVAGCCRVLQWCDAAYYTVFTSNVAASHCTAPAEERVCCNVLQGAVVCCSGVLQYITLSSPQMLHHCNAQPLLCNKCVAGCCSSVLQWCVVAHCTVFTSDVSASQYTATALQQVCCSVLQCVAVCCSVLQCVAVCCIELQCIAL